MVVITGGAGGIARATAPLLLAEGADLHLIDPDRRWPGKRWRPSWTRATAMTTAASAIDSPEACEAALAKVTRPVYGLVHLAGVFLQDDLDACLASGLERRRSPPISPTPSTWPPPAARGSSLRARAA